MKFTLEQRTKNPSDNEEVYLYRGEDGTTVKFQADNKVAFQYLRYKSSTASPKVCNKLIDAFIKAGFSQHDFEGGFYEAIATLNV